MKPSDRPIGSRSGSASSRLSNKPRSSLSRPPLQPTPPLESIRQNASPSHPPSPAITLQLPKWTKETRSAVEGKQNTSDLRSDVADIAQAQPGMQAPAGPPQVASPIIQRFKSRGSLKEDSLEDVTSPSLEAAFASPLTTGILTASTTSSGESVESAESAKTVKGTSLNTPSYENLRTPSYPFPRMPSSASIGTWPPPLHQPFTALSPTDPPPARSSLAARFIPDEVTPGSESGFETERASPLSGASEGEPASPDLYNIVLKLNSDPSLVAWWSNLTDILQEFYSISRASLSLPVDPTDIQNVPWGQKASFDTAGLKRQGSSSHSVHRSSSSSSRYSKGSSSNKSAQSEVLQNNIKRSALPQRPPMESRHSYAGHEAGGIRGGHSVGGKRPQMSRTNTNYDPVNPSYSRDTLTSLDQLTVEPESLTSGLPNQFGTEASSSQDLYTAVFTKLHSLNREVDPLIDASGVNHVMERSKLVVLTREYNTSVNENPKDHHHGQFFGPGQATSEPASRYEEYEQFPPSPWAQSPAPSPAIQADPNENPFFVDEDSFNPASQPPDYAHTGPVEAIGVDKASTIIHIPLIHPNLSKILHAAAEDPPESVRHRMRRNKPHKHRGTAAGVDTRKAPIAILSLFSRPTPYPPELVRSLRLLSPHLATTLHSSQLASSVQEQIARTLLRSDRLSELAASTNQPLSLIVEKLLGRDAEDTASSTAGSIISPSDYSGRSRRSPTSSVASTPRVEPGIQGHVSNPPTPKLIEALDSADNYFEAMRRIPLSRSQSTNIVPQHLASLHASGPSKAFQLSLQSDQRPLRRIDPSGRYAEETRDGMRLDRRELFEKEKDKRSRSSNTHIEKISADGSENLPIPERPQNLHHMDSEQLSSRRHSVLHSYGADFSSSFETMPITAMPRPIGPDHGHGRSSSVSDLFDMPPPSEKLLRTIIDSLPVQIFTAAPNTGAVTWVNSRRLAYSGKTPRQLLEDPWDCVHPDDLEEYTTAWNECLRTGQQFQHKLRLRRFDGSYRWYFARAAPLRAKSGVIVHWSGTFTDFHDTYLAELMAARQQEITASEAKYRALANSSPQIVFAVTRTRGIIFCNSQWVSYSGQPEEQAVGIGFMDHVHPDDLVKCKLPSFDEEPTVTAPPHPQRSSSQASSANASEQSGGTNVTITEFATIPSPGRRQIPQKKLSEMATAGISKVSKDTYSTEIRLRTSNGDYRWHLVRVLLADATSSSDAESVWYGTCSDINDHKELEKNLKETMDAKTAFLANMSHEIRTPLNGIHGMANFLIDSNLTPEQMDQVNVIRASTEGLRDLINDILDLSKVEAGMITLNYDWLYIRAVVEEVNDLTSSLAIDKGIELNYLVEDDVPVVAKGDKFRIRQVLLNVIGNAIKFTQEGEVFLWCKVANQAAGDDSVMLQFDIIDTGRGFSEREAEKLFKRFSQIDASSTRQHGGTGLGLVISMQLVELHGGSMTAKSVPEKGSTFTFSIKLKLPTDDDQPPVLGRVTETIQSPVERGNTGVTRNLSSTPDPSGPPILLDRELTESPALESGSVPVPVPDLLSPASSITSAVSTQRSGQSARSSASSQGSATSSGIRLSTGTEISTAGGVSHRESLEIPGPAQRDSFSKLLPQPNIHRILIVSPLNWTRLATEKHLRTILPNDVAVSITAVDDVVSDTSPITERGSTNFTHIVLVLHDLDEIMNSLRKVLTTKSATPPIVVIITNASQKRDIVTRGADLDLDRHTKAERVLFVFKPVKPSKLSVIFDPQSLRQSSVDHNKTNAQQVAETQKQLFAEMSLKLGNRGVKVLLVEDNKINQIVMLKLLRRVSVDVETVFDGVQCTDKVFSKPVGYYSIILCDLHMPNKDGYQTCKDIREWERQNKHPHLPIIALSANVLGDVYAKCVEAGFNSYLTKPVEFKELSDIMTASLDPSADAKPLRFMQHR